MLLFHWKSSPIRRFQRFVQKHCATLRVLRLMNVPPLPLGFTRLFHWWANFPSWLGIFQCFQGASWFKKSTIGSTNIRLLKSLGTMRWQGVQCFQNNFRRKILHPFWVFSHTCIFSCFFSVLQFQLIFFPVSISFKLPKSSLVPVKKIGQRPSSPIVTGTSIGHFPGVRRRGDRGAWRYHSSLGYSRCGCRGGTLGSWLLLGGSDIFFLRFFYPYLEKWSNWTCAYFSNWVVKKPPTRFRCL